MASPSPDAILHLVALHTLSQAGFASTSSAASITLSNVLSKYLKSVAVTCIERANLAGRGKVSAIDVVDALDDLGVNVDELIDWSSSDEQNGDYFSDGNHNSLGNLQDYLQEGLSVEDGIAQMRLVPEDELEEFDDESQVNDDQQDNEHHEEGGKQHEDIAMGEQDNQNYETGVKVEHDVKGEEEMEYKPFIYRHKSPDLSWLPPIPSTITTTTTTSGIPSQSTQTLTKPYSLGEPDEPSSEAPSLPAPSQSIADRYRKPISYSSSQLYQAHPFHDPPRPPQQQQMELPPAPTSLPNLISTYSAITNDPSIALRQTDIRRQATEILRQSISTVDSYSPKPTLSTPIPPVKSSSIVPSHTDILPTKLLPINPTAHSQNGILSSLVNQINSPNNLPYSLKERLTSLRPPVPQNKNDQPVFYNENLLVHGPDDLSLLKFKSNKNTSITTNGGGEEEGDKKEKEIILKQTWDSGPRGYEKWSKPFLPKGKKIIIQKEGEKKPRMSKEDLDRIQKEQEDNEKRILEQQQQQQPNQNGKVRVNLRLPSFNGNGNSINNFGEGEQSLASTSDQQSFPSEQSVDGNSALSPNRSTTISNGPTPGPGLKIKFGGNSSKLSISPSPLPTPTPNNEYPASVNPY